MTRSFAVSVFELLPSLEKEMLLLRHLVSPGDVCVDVGASYGIYTVALGRVVGRTGRVHAFEPRHRSLAVLRAVTRLLTPGNVELHAIALSDAPGAEVLVTPRRRWHVPVPGRTFLKHDLQRVARDGYYDGWAQEFAGATERHVRTETLDALVTRWDVDRIAFIKIDVEGAELRVLDGAATTLKTHRPTLLLELEDRHTAKYGHRAQDVAERLVADGYRMVVFDGRRLRPTGRVRADENNYVFIDGVGRS